MTPDELRALAERLHLEAETTRRLLGQQFAAAFDFDRAADYLRVCADAHPAPAAPQAADRCRSSEMSDPKATGPASPERPASNREDAAATVAAGSGEQAEPCIGNDPTCPCQDGDACHYRDAADGTKGWPVPQAEPKRPAFLDEIGRVKEHIASWPQWMKDAMVSAAATLPVTEPKREPTCLWSRADDDTDMWETSCFHAFTIIEGTPGENHMAFCCYCGRPLEQEIGGSDE